MRPCRCVDVTVFGHIWCRLAPPIGNGVGPCPRGDCAPQHTIERERDESPDSLRAELVPA